MKYLKKIIFIFFLLNTALVSSQEIKESSVTTDLSGYFRVDYRYYPHEKLFQEQNNSYFSTVIQPELLMEWDRKSQILQFTGFARLDQYKNSRTHADIREFYWQIQAKKWDMSVGVKKIFWGVTESNHLVDIINQYDMYEGIDIEQKLGQPMVHLSSGFTWGTLDLFMLSYSRKVKFPGDQGRLRPSVSIDYDDAKYESHQEEFNTDFAIRWSSNISIFDIGVSHFYGNSRLPRFIPTNDMTMVPYYEKVNHSGIDMQALTGAMLWKMEVINQFRKNDRIYAFTIGGEYIINEVFSTNMEISLMTEYTYDERDQEVLNGINNEIFIGTRIALNDKQSTDIIAGFVTDTEYGTRVYTLELNRRINSNCKLQLDSKIFNNVNADDPLYSNRKDSYIQVSLYLYF
jgi:hypothetical protein